MPKYSYYYSFPEESRYIAVISPPGLIHIEIETSCHFNTITQLLYCNVLFRQLILKMDCYTMMNSMDKSNKQFAHNYQNIMAVK